MNRESGRIMSVICTGCLAAIIWQSVQKAVMKGKPLFWKRFCGTKLKDSMSGCLTDFKDNR